jgi:hypothetical protein
MKLLILMFFSALIMAGCGPEQTQREKDDAERREIINKAINDYAPIAGTYLGKIHMAVGGQDRDIQIIIQPLMLSTPNPSRATSDPVASLAASFTLCLHDGCFEPGVKEPTFFPLGTTNSVSYDSETGNISFYMGAQTSSGNTGTGSNMGSIFFVGKYSANKITGNLTANRPTGYLVVTKISDTLIEKKSVKKKSSK